MMGDCEIVSGLEDDDMIAFPSDSYKEGMRTTTNAEEAVGVEDEYPVDDGDMNFDEEMPLDGDIPLEDEIVSYDGTLPAEEENADIEKGGVADGT